MHIRICFSKICVNNIEYVKLKTHGKITRMDSIALLKWYVFFVLSTVALFTLAASSLQPARGNRMFTALVRSQYDFILKCVKELFFAWVFSSIQFTKPREFEVLIQQCNTQLTIRTRIKQRQPKKTDHTMHSTDESKSYGNLGWC